MCLCIWVANLIHRTLSLIGYINLGLTFTVRSYRISCTKVNWVVGRRYSSSFCEFWNPSMRTSLLSLIGGRLKSHNDSCTQTKYIRVRYREIPAFGRDAIRRFSANCSEMKKMAARDFENLLQVRCIPTRRFSMNKRIS